MSILDPDVAPNNAAEPAYCPACELKHTRRPDWLCPRCRMPVEADVPPPRAPRAAPLELRFPHGSRIAGAFLAATGGALATGLAKVPAGEHRWPLLAAVVVLAVLGLALLLGVSAARWIVAAVAVVAAAVVAEHLIRDRLPDLMRDPLPVLARARLRDLLRPLGRAAMLASLGLQAGCVVLVAGRPRRVRIAVGAILAAPLLVLAILRAVEILRASGR
jgi:hypothetical protein